MDNTINVMIPVDAEAAKALESPARREAVGRYLSSLLKKEFEGEAIEREKETKVHLAAYAEPTAAPLSPTMSASVLVSPTSSTPPLLPPVSSSSSSSSVHSDGSLDEKEEVAMEKALMEAEGDKITLVVKVSRFHNGDLKEEWFAPARLNGQR